MQRIFGVGKKQPTAPKEPPPSLHDASKQMDDRASSLDQKIKACDEELLKYKAALQKGGMGTSGLKKRAVDTLRRKKMYEAQRDQLLSTQFNVDQAQFATEQLSTTIMTVDAMKAANTTLRAQMKEVNLDSVEDMMDDLEDLMMESNEIQETLGRSYALPDGIDEGELEMEFQQLEEEVALDAIQGVGAAQPTPSYLPTGPPQGQGIVLGGKKEEGEYAQLEQMGASAPPLSSNPTRPY